MKTLQYIPGIMFTIILALLVIPSLVCLFINYLNLSSLIIAILLGMLLGNLMKLPDLVKPGLTFSSKTILRLAIILLGFKLSISDVFRWEVRNVNSNNNNYCHLAVHPMARK